jgi:hypothetical protein
MDLAGLGDDAAPRDDAALVAGGQGPSLGEGGGALGASDGDGYP